MANKQITENAARSAEATLQAYRAQERQAADHAARLEQIAREEHKRRFADTRAHFESALADEVRAFAAGDADAPTRIALIIPEAIEACDKIDVTFRASRGRVTARAKACLRSLPDDATACVRLYAAICDGFGVAATGLDCVERGAGETFDRVTVKHPVTHYLLVAWEAPTARNVEHALNCVAGYLAHYTVRGGRQIEFRDPTTEGREAYSAWLDSELGAIHRPEAPKPEPRPERRRVKIGGVPGDRKSGRWVYAPEAAAVAASD